MSCRQMLNLDDINQFYDKLYQDGVLLHELTNINIDSFQRTARTCTFKCPHINNVMIDELKQLYPKTTNRKTFLNSAQIHIMYNQTKGINYKLIPKGINPKSVISNCIIQTTHQNFNHWFTTFKKLMTSIHDIKRHQNKID